jgi:hypothetical protein
MVQIHLGPHTKGPQFWTASLPPQSLAASTSRNLAAKAPGRPSWAASGLTPESETEALHLRIAEVSCYLGEGNSVSTQACDER